MKKQLLPLLLVTLFSLSGCGETTSEGSGEIVMEDDPATDYVLDADATNANGSMSYEIFVRSFYDSDGDGIGDLKGVESKIPYLASLGIKTVWLMPIQPSPSYHGYDITNYYDINPDYGTLEDFESLVSTAKNAGIDIMMDLVINHCSIKNKYFLDAYDDYILGNESADSKADWFNWGEGYADHVYKGTYYESYFSADMPDFNLDSEGVRTELAKIIKFWIDEGVSGYRLDGVYYYYRGNQTKNVEFLSWVKETASGYNSDIYLVGECWTSDSLLNSYYSSTCDSFFRFSSASGGDSSLINFIKGYGNASDIATGIENSEARMKNRNANAYSSYFLSNHDQDRISKNFTAEVNKAAASMYILLPGTPFMYYGEEISLIGKRKTTPDDASDVKRRLPMIWSSTDKTGECDFPDPTRSDLDDTKQVTVGVDDQLSTAFSLTKHYQKVINVRNKYPFIKDGVFTSMVSSLNTEEKSVIAYKITNGDKYIIVVHNFSSHNVKVTAPGTRIVDSINVSHQIPTVSDGELTLGSLSSVVMM